MPTFSIGYNIDRKMKVETPFFFLACEGPKLIIQRARMGGTDISSDERVPLAIRLVSSLARPVTKSAQTALQKQAQPREPIQALGEVHVSGCSS